MCHIGFEVCNFKAYEPNRNVIVNDENAIKSLIAIIWATRQIVAALDPAVRTLWRLDLTHSVGQTNGFTWAFSFSISLRNDQALNSNGLCIAIPDEVERDDRLLLLWKGAFVPSYESFYWAPHPLPASDKVWVSCVSFLVLDKSHFIPRKGVSSHRRR